MKQFLSLLCVFLMVQCGTTKKSNTAVNLPLKSFYTLRVYHASNSDQVNLIDNFLKSALLPALRRQGITRIGVFKPVTNDTAADKKIIVFTPYKSLEQFETTTRQLRTDITLEQLNPAYVNAPHNSPAFAYFETILLEAFDDMPEAAGPKLSSAKKDRIYELRSYEGPTEKLYQNKVQMFNEGGEIALFTRLNFNAVFYATVLAGARMPNLMYMTSFENMADRDAHWKTFVDDPEWKILSSKKEYQNNVSKIDITLLTPADYSDF